MVQLPQVVRAVRQSVMGDLLNAEQALTWALQWPEAGLPVPVRTTVEYTLHATLVGHRGSAVVRTTGDGVSSAEVHLELPCPLTPRAIEGAPWRGVFLALHEAAHIQVLCSGHWRVSDRLHHDATWRARFVEMIRALSPRSTNVPNTLGRTFGRSYLQWQEDLLLSVCAIDPHPVLPWHTVEAT